MAKEKLSTQEVLALARKQGALGGGGPAPADSAPSAEQESAAPSAPGTEPEATTPAAAPVVPAGPRAAAPKSTADILATARAGGSAAAAGSPPKAAAAPRSTADILAAARSQKAGTAAPAAAGEKPAKPMAAKTAKAAASGAPAGRSVQEMVKALHEGKPPVAEPVKPRLPGKPPLPPRPAEQPLSRRAFPIVALGTLVALIASPFAAAWTMMAIIGGLWSLLTARFMMPNMVVQLPSKFKIGPASDFPLGTVSEKFKASRGTWVVHSDAYNGENILYALISVCTHLGCTPNWLESEQKFKCPCHGSGFYISGINFEGPAPRPLERAGIRVSEDGMLEVDKSVKFQEELGQWADVNSYVKQA
jgi:cytochrome b6-f complex iron-sulfur subunit